MDEIPEFRAPPAYPEIQPFPPPKPTYDHGPKVELAWEIVKHFNDGGARAMNADDLSVHEKAAKRSKSDLMTLKPCEL